MNYEFELAGTGNTQPLAAGSLESAQAAVAARYWGIVWADQPDADGLNDGGEQCWRLLAWASEEDAEDDCGERAFGQLTWIGGAR